MKKLIAMDGFSVNGSGKSTRTPIYHGVQKGNPAPLLPLNHDFNGGNGIVHAMEKFQKIKPFRPKYQNVVNTPDPKGGLNWKGGQKFTLKKLYK